MKLIKGEFKEKLDLLFAPSIRAGFPSPAEDYLSDSLDFNRDCRSWDGSLIRFDYTSEENSPLLNC